MRRLVRATLWLGGAGLTVAGAYVGVGLLRANRPRRAYLNLSGPWLIAHRGGSALWPENTLLSFSKALEMGADALEMDIHPSAEGIPIVIHDDTVDRTTDGTGKVSSLSLARLRQLDGAYRFSPDGMTFPYRGTGVRVPTLEEVLAIFPQARINVEVKNATEPLWAHLRALIERHGCHDRVLLASAQDGIRRRLERDFVDVARSASYLDILEAMAFCRLGLGRLWRPTYDALQLPITHEGWTVVTPELIRMAHRAGIAVHVWTVDEEEEMFRLLDWGVDGIMTDRPDRLLAALRRRGQR